MVDPGDAEALAIRLVELSREIDDLELGRMGLLERLNLAREALHLAGQRTAAMRASVDLLYEHLSNSAMALRDLRALEEEMEEAGASLEGEGKEATGLLFETESFGESLDDAEEDLERMSAILIEGTLGRSRGH